MKTSSRPLSARCLAGWLFLMLALAWSGPAAARVHKTHLVKHTAAKSSAASKPVKRGRRAAYTAPASSSLLMDADTGQVFESSNADAPLHPASLTKTMTLLLTFEALERGDLRLRDPVPISNHAAAQLPSKLDRPPGSSIAVEDAIYAVVTKSANDIAVALAEKLGGTEGRFANMMNRRAQQLGMVNTHFENASGLHDPEQLSSARDMAALARYIIVAHPRAYKYFATRDFIYRGVLYRNHNHLMETYRGMDGMKTGFTSQSGFNLIASAKRDGHRLIGVIFGGRSTAARNADMANLLNQGFAYEKKLGDARQNPAIAAQTIAPPLAALAAASDENDPRLQTGAFSAVIGQGDSEPGAASRVETGLLAMDNLRGRPGAMAAAAPALTFVAPAAAPAPMTQPGPAMTASAQPGSWSIQIGASADRAQIDRSLRQAATSLPPPLSQGSPVIMPLQTAQGWSYRGRLTGYSQDQAYAACRLLSPCQPVAPQDE